MKGGERGGARGRRPPPLEIGKKDAVRGNFNLFHLCFSLTYEIRGESIHCTSKVEGWADRRVSIVEGGEGALPSPLKMGKNVVRRNFNLFHLCFTNEIRGDRQTLVAYMQNGRGWADRRLSMVGEGGGLAPPPPLENEKKEAA